LQTSVNTTSSHWWKAVARSLSARTLAICLAVAVFACLVLTWRPPLLYDFLSGQELRLSDQFFLWRALLAGGRGGQAAPDLVLVNVDSESARRLGMPLPWPRQVYALLCRRLREAGARVVAFDLLFDGPSPLSAGASAALSPRLKAVLPDSMSLAWSTTADGDDRALADEFRRMKNVVLADNVEVRVNLFNGRTQYFYRTPYEEFVSALGSDAGSIGNVDVQPDEDGVVRRAPLVLESFKHLSIFYHSFGLRVCEKAEKARAVVDGQERLALAGGWFPHTIRINYLGPAGSVTAIPFWRAVDWEKHFVANPFSGRIVLVGYQDSPASEELVPQGALPHRQALPFNSFLTPTAGFSSPMSGVELQANVIANILNRRPLSEPDLWEQILIVFFVALLAARILEQLRGKPWWMLVSVVCFSVIWLALSFAAFAWLGCVIPVVVPTAGVAFPALLLVLTDQNLFFVHERRKHTRIFRSLVPQALAEEIERRRLGELGLEGKTAVVTTLSFQLQGLTPLIEHKTPEAAIRMLDQCVAIMTASVHERNGLVNRVSNHGLMAVWGAPLPVPEISGARLAADCCLDAGGQLASLSAAWQREGRINSNQALSFSCGISTGPASCGRMGSESHTEYGVIGRCVDLAFLLEVMNKKYGTRCLVAERTSQILSEHFEIRELDKVKLEAGDKPQYIYELLCPKGKLPGAMEEAAALYRQGLAAMEERNFAEAERVFSTILLRLVPDDRPAAIMLERVRGFLRTPPEPDWDGAVLVADLM